MLERSVNRERDDFSGVCSVAVSRRLKYACVVWGGTGVDVEGRRIAFKARIRSKMGVEMLILLGLVAFEFE